MFQIVWQFLRPHSLLRGLTVYSIWASGIRGNSTSTSTLGALGSNISQGTSCTVPRAVGLSVDTNKNRLELPRRSDRPNCYRSF